MKWGVVGKGGITHVQKEAEFLIGALLERGQSVVVDAELTAPEGVQSMRIEDMDVDIILTVGGDGTILHAQHHHTAPVFGVNCGAIGFLAEVEPPMALEALDRIISGDYRVEERYKLASWLDGQRLADATNEITLQTSRIAKLIRFEAHVDGELLDIFRGDGIIVSTPTGSTGYAMSVGGPLMHPGVNGLVLAPIAPFKLSARPWVVPASAKVELKLLERDSAQGVQQARVVIDGQIGHDVATGGTLTLEISDRKARFIRLSSGFYERVRTKLTR